jgi:hypothetical protein
VPPMSMAMVQVLFMALVMALVQVGLINNAVDGSQFLIVQRHVRGCHSP